MSPKILILIRHAHRTTEEAAKDNGLSPKGQAQVKKLVKFAKRRLTSLTTSKSAPKPKVKFYSSPKKRCIETIAPIARELNQKIEIDDLLTEHAPSENQSLYLARITEFLDTWKYEGEDISVVCSHGDWLPVAIEKLTGCKTGLRKSGWAEVEFFNGMCTLTWLVQRHY